MLHRRGLSLTEVLIAIFIMAIGMISLLALFPIGLLRMNAAIRHNRMAMAAANAQSMVEWQGIRSDSTIINSITGDTDWNAMATNGYPPPVFVDPLGTAASFNTRIGTRPATTRGNSRGIPRSSVSFATNTYERMRWFTLEDDLSFNPDGRAIANGTPALVERERRFSWGYLWRRPVWGEPSVVDLTVILFSGRNLGQSVGSDPDSGVGGPSNDKVFTAGSRNATVLWPSGQQALRPGYWVLDTTAIRANPPTQPNYYVNGYFYQVTSVSDMTSTNTQSFEIDRPARADGYACIFMTGVADVIEKGNGRMP